MALFEYRSITESGRLMTGAIEASDIEQARQQLSEMKLQVTEIEKASEKLPKAAVGRGEFLLFNQQLASLTQAGIPLERGLRELAADIGSSKIKSMVEHIADDLEKGIPIEQAVEKYQAQLPPLYGSMLKAGIATGRLSQMLTNLNRHLQVQQRTRRIIIESVMYPAMVLAVAALLVTLILVTVIPTFSEVLSDMSGGRAHLPWATRQVLFLSQHVWSFWTGTGVLIGAVMFFWLSLSATASGRRSQERLLMRIPLLGRVWFSGTMAALCEAMGVLVVSGTTLDKAFSIAGQSCQSELIKQECEVLVQGLEQGSGVMEAGMNCRIMPRLFLYSIQLSSQRNELADSLQILSQMYSQKTFSLQSNLQTILLPFLIIAVGLFVGFIVLAMFLPMIRITTVLM